MATVTHAGRVDAHTVLLADDDEDFRAAPAQTTAIHKGDDCLEVRLGSRRQLGE